ncbi:fimbria/pilus outer membrane usher protein [Acinetobacter bouvetii]|uniref:Outer membrane usher protein YehB n=1 Tax=Acinetobacter bouvetii TaxID=202951 RepID=A0A811GJ55_9GAMM|nr:fimbria/pilus outer membrane usher protein [Acinetobacter bouvetii]CAB1215728.1 Outer membrane usher protein YehB [Acinetobacter bouvetii]
MKKQLVICLSMAVMPCYTQAETAHEEFMATLYINQIDQKTDLLIIKKDQQWLTACQDLANTFLDLQALTKVTVAGQSYCMLNTAPITAEFNDAQQSLQMHVPPSFMQNSEQKNNHPNLAAASAPFGGYLNYDALYKKISQQQSYNEFGLKNDLSLFKDNLLFKNSTLLHHSNKANETQDQFTRLFTQFSLEQPNHLTTLQIGDSISPSSPVSRGVYFAGLQYGTSFMQRPGFVYWNIPSIVGSALTPSTVDLYINGIKNYSTKVNPGEFNIQSGALFNGDGKGQMIIEDVLGNKTVQDFDLSVTDQLLRKGLQDYNISAGRLRYNFDEDSNDYRDYFTSVYFRTGLTDTLNLGFSANYLKDLQNFGAFSSQYVPHLGMITLGAAYSHANSANGQKFNLGISKNASYFNLGFNTEYNSEHFKTMGMDDSQNLPKFDHLLYAGLNQIPFIGHLTFNYVEQSQYKKSNLSDKRIFSLRGGKALFSSLYFNYGLSYENQSKDKLLFDLAFSYQFDNKHSAYLSKNNSALYAAINKTDLALTGFDYSASVGKNHESTIFNTDTTLKKSFGDLNLRYSNNQDAYQAQADFQGAFVFLDHSIGLTKSIEYPFALVRLSNQENIDIYKNNEFVGKTNKKGELFVHRLIAYANHDISYDQNQLPIEYETPILNRNLVPYDLRGYVVDLPIIRSFDLSFKLTDFQGAAIPAGSMISYAQNPDHSVPVGSQGIVTIYGLKESTQYTFTVKTGPEQHCTFSYLTAAFNNNNTLIPATCR